MSVCLAEKAVPVRLCLERKQSKYSEQLSLETFGFGLRIHSTTPPQSLCDNASAVRCLTLCGDFSALIESFTLFQGT